MNWSTSSAMLIDWIISSPTQTQATTMKQNNICKMKNIEILMFTEYGNE